MDINKAHKGHLTEKGVRKPLHMMEVMLNRTLIKDEACTISKAKHKPIRKFTAVRLLTPREHFFIDIAGSCPIGSKKAIQIILIFLRYYVSLSLIYTIWEHFWWIMLKEWLFHLEYW